MKILGIPLRTPSVKDLGDFLIRLLVGVVIVGLLVHFRVLNVNSASGAIVGLAGALLAMACGCTVREHGLRVGVVWALFSMAMAIACLVIIAVAAV
ncbi:hypothetical protein [Pseudomonas aeruginosa]|uniref:hypothetical protein n=1 Tax=Pseudomonas aeruginosa TaxID=287 RepID=UPI00065819A0|nr:hypothetical protein [Pseudomonas aeruginosa]OTH75854.1 hypothetical protein CAZ03_32010 [Pseudomonas aeruginosa]CRP50519.1 hypothetical protein PAERUG_P26_Wales_1_VIM_2_11_10_05470 [Pseudomonas aeruginosa]CRP78183.1 hypothetical protein PAERUG_P27_Wales_1_VIM_2_02_11_05346 [Pseudomonas aeruginosa]HCE5933793.1 hypothetical protein [Pseudomonas aeruginosa]HCE6046614.1 hypothetical protein [Pseudomonas aeruginosa]